jgi:hypothetical protein
MVEFEARLIQLERRLLRFRLLGATLVLLLAIFVVPLRLDVESRHGSDLEVQSLRIVDAEGKARIEASASVAAGVEQLVFRDAQNAREP